ncbi:MAG: response regulator, partial [Bdellovibrionales bacterium]|nr:response regulator [Bdellovibrionales bacterium]
LTNIHIVNDGLAALEQFKEHDFDIVLMDIQMPIMDGLEATRQIIAYEKQSAKIHVPIIAVTAHALVQERERYLKSGMDGYITKPLDRNELWSVIAKCLDSGQD